MRVSTKRILSIGCSFLLLIGALVVYTNFIRDAGTEIGKLRATIASKSNLLANQRRAVTQVKSLIAELQNVGRLQDTVSLAMPEGVNAIQALRQVEAVARASGVVLSSAGFKTVTLPKAKQGTFVERLGIIEMQIRADGAYGNLKQFLQLLESGVRVSNAKEFNYVGGGTRGADSLALTAETYYQQP